jgi:hypothetical protein
MTDYSAIPARHDAIDRRLTEWSRWVKVHPAAWPMQPMFRGYQSKARQWEAEPAIRININTLAAHEIEKAVSALPEKQMTAIRWAYVFVRVPVIKMRSELGTTSDGLRELIDSGRDMLKNRLHIL